MCLLSYRGMQGEETKAQRRLDTGRTLRLPPMPRAGTRTPLSPRRTLPATVVDHTVADAAALLDKWHPDDSTCSLFLDSTTPDEAADFLRAVADLHRAMLFYASGQLGLTTGAQGLVQAQELLDTAMRRLQLELHILLSSLPTVFQLHHDDDDDHHHQQQQAASHLRAVADTMVAAGYGKECVSTFKARRRAALSSTLQRLLGFSPSVQHTQLHKLTWDQVDTKMQAWISGARVAFKSVISAERELCDGVFAGDNATVGDAVFAAIAHDQAVSLIAFAEAAVARARRAPERLFRVLDVHDALTETILPAIVAVFGDKSEVTSRAVALVMTKVGEAARSMVASFEAAIQKEPSKATAPGGAVHPLTRYVMNYLVFLADYENGLAHIFQHQQQQHGESLSGSGSPDLSSSFSSSSPSSSSLSLKLNPIGWLVLVLLRKLEAKAGSYKEAALSYLFLANNTHYIAKKVGGSAKLAGILGLEWAEAQRAKAIGYVDVYGRAAWGSKVVTALRGGGGEGVAAVEEALVEAVATQERWVAADEEMGYALRAAARTAVVPTYRLFYRRHGAIVRLTPGDVSAMIGGLFGGEGGRWHSTSRPQEGSIPVPKETAGAAAH